MEATPERKKWADMEVKDVEENESKNMDSGDDCTEEKQEENEDDVGFEKYESNAQKKKKKKKKKKDEEEDTKTVGDDDRLKEMMGEDVYHQLKEMFATFRSDMKSAFKEMLRSNLETIREEARSR